MIGMEPLQLVELISKSTWKNKPRPDWGVFCQIIANLKFIIAGSSSG